MAQIDFSHAAGAELLDHAKVAERRELWRTTWPGQPRRADAVARAGLRLLKRRKWLPREEAES